MPTVRRGDSVRVEVVVRTRKVGHFFPGGTVDAQEAWVELEAVDDQRAHDPAQRRGGGRGARPHRPRRAHLPQPPARRAGQPHQQAQRLDGAVGGLRAAHPARAPPTPSTTGCASRRTAGDTIRLRAKVNYRKFSWWNTQWAFAGVRDPAEAKPSVTPNHDDGKWVFTGDTSGVSGDIKTIPNIPTTIMASAEATLKVAAKGAAAARGRARSWTSPCASAGTTTASASSSRATSRARKRRS